MSHLDDGVHPRANTGAGTDAATAPATIAVDARHAAPAVLREHLSLGGRALDGRTIDVTSYYLERDGRPCIPVMGEFHYARFPRRYWDEELRKIKAGGVDILATYVFWIHHEEDEGLFDWAGERDLRAFVQLCARHGLEVVARIGPFAHGECRNGGFPDWLYGRPFAVRSTDDRFLSYVRRFYAQIAAQLDGLLFKDGGPVIGVQLDNEYMHCGAPWEVTYRAGMEWVSAGDEGEAYLRTLLGLAQEAGLAVPLYTCTAWLGSPIVADHTLPLQGGYAFTPWVPDPAYRQPPTREFLFRDRHRDPVTGGAPTYDPARYPYACCELGGGIQITYQHRPVVPAECVEAMAVVALGSGANLLGYYMYHGGSQPVGRHGYLNEHTVPRISYDFQAPIREFGQLAPSYRALNLPHLFLHDFGAMLAPMGVALPAGGGAVEPEDAATPRCAVRARDGAGFLFLTNYQDHVEMRDQRDLRFRIDVGDETVALPRAGGLTLRAGASAILPFNLPLGDIRLTYATAQPLTIVDTPDATIYVFFAPPGMRAEYAVDRSTYRTIEVADGECVEHGQQAIVSVRPGTSGLITLKPRAGGAVRIMTLTRDQALGCWKQPVGGRERLILSDAAVMPDDGGLHLSSVDQATFDVSVFPDVPGGLRASAGPALRSRDGLFTRYTVDSPAHEALLTVAPVKPGWYAVRCTLDALSRGGSIADVLLRIDYVGDSGEAYIDGQLVADNFWNGTTWEIGLKRFTERLAGRELIIHVTPPTGAAPRYVPTGMAVRLDETGAASARISAMQAVPVYETVVWPGLPEGTKAPRM